MSTRPFLLALLVLLLPAAAAAQARERGAVRAVEVGTDNDAYDFWIPPDVRPDRDYTYGGWLAAEVDAAPLWGRLAKGRPACRDVASRAAGCLSTRLELGQKLFTPRVDGAEPVPGERPYAGWLYLAATARVADARARREVGVEAGVTGEPALGEPVHRLVHRIGGFWEPEGWDHQIPFEPGLVVRYDEARLLGEVRAADGTRVAEVAPQWGASLGNVLTGARVGVRARAGWRLPHPWGAEDGARRGFAAWGTAGVRQDWVGHNLFLDGSTFGDRGVRVERRPFVTQGELGAGVRFRGLTAEYVVTVRGREYETQIKRHTYGTILLRYERAAPATPPK